MGIIHVGQAAKPVAMAVSVMAPQEGGWKDLSWKKDLDREGCVGRRLLFFYLAAAHLSVNVKLVEVVLNHLFKSFSKHGFCSQKI